MRERRRAPTPIVPAAVGLALALAGCATVPPSPSATAQPSQQRPSASATAAAAPSGTVAWQQAVVVEPTAVTAATSLDPGYFCSPCHPAAAGQLFGIGSWPGGFLAVGVQQPPAVAIAYASGDGARWVPVAGFPIAEGTTAIAVASNGTRTVVVGSDSAGAAAWTTTGNGSGWAPGSGTDLRGPAGATAMTTVVATADGFVAGGYRDDPLHGLASAAAWRTADGTTWRRDGGAVFAEGRIWGMASRAGTIVAVGTTGDPTYGPAAAWRWTSATGWRRASIEGDGRGVMRAVTAASDGFVAVGYDGADDGTAVWRSTDGARWTRVSPVGGLAAVGRPVRMLSVAADDHGLVAGGWTSDAANGSAAAWESPDGVSWSQAEWTPVFSGGQMPGVTLAGGQALGVGRTGYPDNNQATAWIGIRR